MVGVEGYFVDCGTNRDLNDTQKLVALVFDKFGGKFAQILLALSATIAALSFRCRLLGLVLTCMHD